MSVDPREHVGLVYLMAGKMYRRYPAVRRWLGMDEAVGVGMLALMKAAQAFDPERGYTFATYATNAIAKEICKAARHQGVIAIPEGVFGAKYSCCDEARRAKMQWQARLAQRVAFTGVIKHREKVSNTREALLFQTEYDPRADEKRERLSHARELLDLPGLDPGDRKLMQMYFFGGRTMEGIASRLGITKERVRQRIGRGIRVIRRHLGIAAMTPVRLTCAQ